MNYKICFSITCHEHADSLGDIFERINYYAPNSCAVVACGETSGEHFYREVCNVASGYNNIFVNPELLSASWGDGRLVNLIMSNFKWAYDNLDFEYFWLEASNALIVTPGIEEYVSKYGFGARYSKITESSEWVYAKNAINDPVVKSLLQDLNPGGSDLPFIGQHEGLFSAKNHFKYVYDKISPYLPLAPTDYPREESLIQTCLESTRTPEELIAPPGCQMWCSEEVFNKVLKNDVYWLNEHNVFSVKPVDRKYDSELRTMLRLVLRFIKQNEL